MAEGDSDEVEEGQSERPLKQTQGGEDLKQTQGGQDRGEDGRKGGEEDVMQAAEDDVQAGGGGEAHRQPHLLQRGADGGEGPVDARRWRDEERLRRWKEEGDAVMESAVVLLDCDARYGIEQSTVSNALTQEHTPTYAALAHIDHRSGIGVGDVEDQEEGDGRGETEFKGGEGALKGAHLILGYLQEGQRVGGWYRAASSDCASASESSTGASQAGCVAQHGCVCVCVRARACV